MFPSEPYQKYKEAKAVAEKETNEEVKEEKDKEANKKHGEFRAELAANKKKYKESRDALVKS